MFFELHSGGERAVLVKLLLTVVLTSPTLASLLS